MTRRRTLSRGGGIGTPRLWTLLRIAAGVLVPALLVAKLGTGPVVAAWHAVDAVTAVAALAIGGVTTVASAARWRRAARITGDPPLALRTAVADCYQALLVNSTLPAGIVGDVERAARRGPRAVIAERLAGQVVVVATAGAVLLAPSGDGATVAVGMLVGLPLAALLAQARWAGRAGTGARIRDAARAVLDPGVLGLSAVALAGYVATFVLAAGAAGVTAPVAALLGPVLLALLAMTVPVGVGGWGPREAAAAAGFGAAGLGAGGGLTAAVVYGLLALVACLPGVAVIAARALSLRAGRRRTSAPGCPAPLVPSPRTPVTVARSLPIPCTPPSPATAGAVARRRRDPAVAV
jgi:glycosyltransferase 2 family protein